MKTTKLIIATVSVATLLLLFTAGIPSNGVHDPLYNAGGTAASTGSPGEAHTCSQAGCHGAGNGTSSSGGLADNAGNGSIVFSSVPSMTANQYVPGTTYSIIVTISEIGKANFGFDAEMLDNSGNTNLMVNNTSGTITITDAIRTHTTGAFGTGRKCVTHSLNGGQSVNTSSFTFNWKAPASGTVNVYLSGVAANNDNLPNAIDNVYLQHTVISPAAPTGIKQNFDQTSLLNLYPNPTTDKLNLSFMVWQTENIKISLYALDGKEVKVLADTKIEEGLFKENYTVDELERGIYFLKISSPSINVSKKLILK